MYHVPYFKANNKEEILAFMQQHPFAIICGISPLCKPVATHIPVLLEERNGVLYIQGHLMRKQEHTIAFEENNNVLTIFNGPSSYISANLYQPQNVASTYNYQAVHASGTMHFFDGEQLIELLEKLTNFFEKDTNSVAAVKNMDAAYVQQHSKAIVGFEITITDIQHIFKLSQNKDHATQQRVQQFLQQGNEQQQQLAKAMDNNQ
jgi:transcriptional regulator